ncbi:MAG: HlyD family efflux transporter periplasmic adaptor subunit [Magnetococcus sp. WYHC-3]
MSESVGPGDGALLAATLRLEGDIRHCVDAEALWHLARNGLFPVLPFVGGYSLSRRADGRYQVTGVSGLPAADPAVPLLIWVAAAFSALAPSFPATGSRAPFPILPGQLPAPLAAEWGAWFPAWSVWLPLGPEDDPHACGVWFTRDAPWSPLQTALAQQLAGALAFALARRPRRDVLAAAGRMGRWQRLVVPLVVAAVVAAGVLVRVPLSILAPFEVVDADPFVVTAPLEGVVREMLVAPNALVAEGAALVRMDDAELATRHEAAQGAVQAARAALETARRTAVGDTTRAAEMTLLQSRLRLRENEAEFLAAQLAQVVVRAPRSGMALFGDPQEWRGRPVVRGERLLTLVDPRRAEVELWVPVGAMIPLQPGDGVSLFFHEQPLQPRQARLRRLGYDSELSPDGVAAYRMRASLQAGEDPPRLGARGMGRLLGPEVPLWFQWLRRPLGAVRPWLGS